MSEPESPRGEGLDGQLRRTYATVLEREPLIGGITGVDLGNDPTQAGGEPVVRVHVVDKENPPEEIRDLMERGEVVLVQGNYRHEQVRPAALPVDRYARFSTVQPGIAISARGGMPGTLGAFVLRHGSLAVLTAGHVLPYANLDVYQPSYPVANSEIADHTVTRTNLVVDAAVARWTNVREKRYEQLETGVTLTSVGIVAKGDAVSKSGLATAVTHGKVDGIGRYVVDGHLIEGFCIVPSVTGSIISEPGDSGSIWFRSPAVGVGLHVGGDTSGRLQDERSIACHLGQVFSVFGLDFA